MNSAISLSGVDRTTTPSHPLQPSQNTGLSTGNFCENFENIDLTTGLLTYAADSSSTDQHLLKWFGDCQSRGFERVAIIAKSVLSPNQSSEDFDYKLRQWQRTEVIKDYQMLEKDGVVIGYRIFLPSQDETLDGVRQSIQGIIAFKAYSAAISGDIIDSINSEKMITFNNEGKPIKLNLSHFKSEDKISSIIQFFLSTALQAGVSTVTISACTKNCKKIQLFLSGLIKAGCSFYYDGRSCSFVVKLNS